MDDAVLDATPATEDDESEGVKPSLTPLDFAAMNYVMGAKAPWRCSKHDDACYGPDELGELKRFIDDMISNTERADSAARLWEINQSWEQRLFRRNYQFNLSTPGGGWGIYGSGGSASATISKHSQGKLFSCNVYGARHKKITALLSREKPPTAPVPADDDNTADQEAAQEAVPYLKAFRHQAQLLRRLADCASYLYTDGSAVFTTYTVASSEYGQEVDEGGDPVPGRREEVEVWGKLERRIPLEADSFEDCGWIKLSRERSREKLRARYPWIREKISGVGNKDAVGQMDRLARTNVRLAVQASSSSGDGYAQATTETVIFFRPYQYESVSEEWAREMLYENFPDGLEVWSCAGELALVREGSMDEHVAVCHSTPGDGQNRESIGTNYLPLQKVLNATISLYDKYFRGTVPLRFGMEPYLDVEALNQQAGSPQRMIPVDGKSLIDAQVGMDAITSIEKTPQPNDAMLMYIQWLITGAAEAMDGGTPAIFGAEADASDKGTFGEARLDRDQALQVFGLTWRDMCWAIAEVERQALESAAANRIADFSVGLPTERVKVRVGKLRGNIHVWPTSTEIPPTLAEQAAEIGAMLSAAPTVPLYASVMGDPRNLEIIRRLPSLTGLHIPGLEDVEAQMEENQKLLSEAPIDNPAIAQLEEQIQQAEANPQIVDTPQGQQALQQLQQALQSLPPKVSSIPVRPDASENHAIHASIADTELNSARGRAMLNGDEEQQMGWENLHLHWMEHMQLAKQLSPPPQIPIKASITVDPTKLPSAAQAIAFERLGFVIPPAALQPQEQTHEVTEETEGLNPDTGVPTKRTVSVVGKPLS